MQARERYAQPVMRLGQNPGRQNLSIKYWKNRKSVLYHWRWRTGQSWRALNEERAMMQRLRGGAKHNLRREQRRAREFFVFIAHNSLKSLDSKK
jgi:hypothetical protein